MHQTTEVVFALLVCRIRCVLVSVLRGLLGYFVCAFCVCRSGCLCLCICPSMPVCNPPRSSTPNPTQNDAFHLSRFAAWASQSWTATGSPSTLALVAQKRARSLPSTKRKSRRLPLRGRPHRAQPLPPPPPPSPPRITAQAWRQLPPRLRRQPRQ